MDAHNPIITTKASCDDHNKRIKELRDKLDQQEIEHYFTHKRYQIAIFFTLIIGFIAGLWWQLS